MKILIIVLVLFLLCDEPDSLKVKKTKLQVQQTEINSKLDSILIKIEADSTREKK